MECYTPNYDRHSSIIYASNLRDTPPSVGQAVVLFAVDTDNPRCAIDTNRLITLDTFGLTANYQPGIITLDTPFGNKPAQFSTEVYGAITGSDLKQVIDDSYAHAESDDPSLRANAILMSGVAEQLGLDRVGRSGHIAAAGIDWLNSQNHDEMSYSQMAAMIYAYLTTSQESLLDAAVQTRSDTQSLSELLRYGSLTATYVDILTDGSGNARQQIEVLSQLLKTDIK